MVWFIPSEFAWMIHSQLQIVRTFLSVFHFLTAVSNSIERVEVKITTLGAEAKRRFTSLWLVYQPWAGLQAFGGSRYRGSADLALILCNRDLKCTKGH